MWRCSWRRRLRFPVGSLWGLAVARAGRQAGRSMPSSECPGLLDIDEVPNRVLRKKPRRTRNEGASGSTLTPGPHRSTGRIRASRKRTINQRPETENDHWKNWEPNARCGTVWNMRAMHCFVEDSDWIFANPHRRRGCRDRFDCHATPCIALGADAEQYSATPAFQFVMGGGARARRGACRPGATALGGHVFPGCRLDCRGDLQSTPREVSPGAVVGPLLLWAGRTCFSRSVTLPTWPGRSELRCCATV